MRENEKRIKEDIFHVGVIGSGKMGISLFNYLLDFEFPLVWICEFEDEVDKLKQQIDKKLKRSLNVGIIDKEKYESRNNSIEISHNPLELKDCNLIIEAITENINQKKDLFSLLDDFVNPEAVFASNSSSITPEEWYPNGERKEKVVGMHFFFPVQFTNISELIITKNTSKDTIHTAKNFLQRVNKKFFLQEGDAAFFLNKLFLDFQAGSYNLCQERSCNFWEMDNLIVRHFFPVGVFEFFDRVGVDVIYYSINRYSEKRDNQKFYQPLLDCLGSLIKKGEMGMKTGEGFYSWDGQQKIIPMDGKSSENFKRIENSVVVQLKRWYVSTAQSFVDKEYCTESDLNYAVKEYMNCEKGPFEI